MQIINIDSVNVYNNKLIGVRGQDENGDFVDIGVSKLLFSGVEVSTYKSYKRNLFILQGDLLLTQEEIDKTISCYDGTDNSELIESMIKCLLRDQGKLQSTVQ